MNKYYTAFDFENQRLGLALAAEDKSHDRCDSDLDMDVTHFWESIYESEKLQQDDDDVQFEKNDLDEVLDEHSTVAFDDEKSDEDDDIFNAFVNGQDDASTTDNSSDEDTDDDTYEIPPPPPKNDLIDEDVAQMFDDHTSNNSKDDIHIGTPPTQEQLDSWKNDVVSAQEQNAIIEEAKDKFISGDNNGGVDPHGDYHNDNHNTYLHGETHDHETYKQVASSSTTIINDNTNKEIGNEPISFTISDLEEDVQQLDPPPSSSSTISPSKGHIDFTVADFTVTESEDVVESSQPAHSPTHIEPPNREPLPALHSSGLKHEDNGGVSSSSSVSAGGIVAILFVTILIGLIAAMFVRRRRQRRGGGGGTTGGSAGSNKKQHAMFQNKFRQAEKNIVGQHRNLNYRDHSSSTSSGAFHDALDDIKYTNSGGAGGDQFHDEVGVCVAGRKGDEDEENDEEQDPVDFVLDSQILQRMN